MRVMLLLGADGLLLETKTGRDLQVVPHPKLTPYLRDLVEAHKDDLLILMTNTPEAQRIFELFSLVPKVTSFSGCDASKQLEALTIALADVPRALECYRSLALKLSIHQKGN